VEVLKEWAPVIGVIAFALATFLTGMQERRQAREISADAASKQTVQALAARITGQDSTIAALREEQRQLKEDLRRCRQDHMDVERALRDAEAEARRLRERFDR
jgi:chromosome segregation ATPase